MERRVVRLECARQDPPQRDEFQQQLAALPQRRRPIGLGLELGHHQSIEIVERQKLIRLDAGRETGTHPVPQREHAPYERLCVVAGDVPGVMAAQ
jgi:hypothetical protein